PVLKSAKSPGAAFPADCGHPTREGGEVLVVEPVEGDAVAYVCSRRHCSAPFVDAVAALYGMGDSDRAAAEVAAGAAHQRVLADERNEHDHSSRRIAFEAALAW